MNNKRGKLDTWAIGKIENEYKDDIALLVGHNAYRLVEDRDKASFSYFFPVTDRGRELARTFIIDGVGYDLFPMSWERIGRMAAFDEDNASVIADAEILYARTEEDRRRFEEVRTRLQNHLKDRRYMIFKAVEKLDIAMGLYQTMLFEDSISVLRKDSGFIMMYLANAVAYSNQTFFSGAAFIQADEIGKMNGLPKDFLTLYRTIPAATSEEDLRQRCFSLIRNTREYLADLQEQIKRPVTSPDYRDLAGWYHELSYEWRQIDRWGRDHDAVSTFVRSCFLQNEIDSVSEEFGLEKMNLLEGFDSDNLEAYRQHAAALERQIVSVIEKNGATLDVYASIDEFIGKNR